MTRLDYRLVEPSNDEQAYLVLSVALSAACCCASLVQAAGQLYHRLPVVSSQQLTHLSHALIGMLTAVAALQPIASISRPQSSPETPHACALWDVALPPLALTTAALHPTLQLLNQLWTGRSWWLQLLLVAVGWLGGAGVALLPWTGWTSFSAEAPAAACHVPLVYSRQFVQLLSGVFLGGTALSLLLLLLLSRRRYRKTTRSYDDGEERAPCVPVSSSTPSRHSLLVSLHRRSWRQKLPEAASSDWRLPFLQVVTAGVSQLMFLWTLDTARQLPLENTLSRFRWTLLAAAGGQLVTTLAALCLDQLLGEATLDWLQTFCCCCRGNNLVRPESTCVPGQDPGDLSDRHN